MSTKKSWDALELEKQTYLFKLSNQMDMLKAKRGDLLLSIGDGKKDKSELEAVDREIKDCDLEIEATQSVLSAIPRRRAFAQADEIETELQAIAVLQKRIVELTAIVDSEAESFARAVSDLLKAVAELSPFTPKFYAPLSYYDFGILDSLGVALRKYDLFKFIKVGKFRDALTASETIKRTLLRDIEGLLSKKGEFARVLRGEMKSAPNRCPECYGNLKLHSPGREDKYCENCGYESGGNKA